MSRHSWYVGVADGLVTMKSGMMGLRILEAGDKWLLGVCQLLPEYRFGIWIIEGSYDSLGEALVRADGFKGDRHNPYGLCNSLWHIEAHSCHSACGGCGGRGFDQKLKDLYKKHGFSPKSAYDDNAEPLRSRIE